MTNQSPIAMVFGQVAELFRSKSIEALDHFSSTPAPADGAEGDVQVSELRGTDGKEDKQVPSTVSSNKLEQQKVEDESDFDDVKVDNEDVKEDEVEDRGVVNDVEEGENVIEEDEFDDEDDIDDDDEVDDESDFDNEKVVEEDIGEDENDIEEDEDESDIDDENSERGEVDGESEVDSEDVVDNENEIDNWEEVNDVEEEEVPVQRLLVSSPCFCSSLLITFIQHLETNVIRY